MQTQIEFIRQLGTQYKKYLDEPAILYKDLNDLPVEVLNDVFNEYGDPDRKFQPVALISGQS